jgi:integrase
VFSTDAGYGHRRGRDGSTVGGGRVSEKNVREVLARAIERANERLTADSHQPIAEDGVTPHSLRRTFISLLLASGADVRYGWARSATPTRASP